MLISQLIENLQRVKEIQGDIRVHRISPLGSDYRYAVEVEMIEIRRDARTIEVDGTWGVPLPISDPYVVLS